MKRRAWLARLAALVAAAAGCARQGDVWTAVAAPRWGPVDLTRHTVLSRQGVFLRVTHRGVDVTSRCYYADDTGLGVAHLFKHRDGRPYLDPTTGDAARETVTGITLTIGDPT